MRTLSAPFQRAEWSRYPWDGEAESEPLASAKVPTSSPPATSQTTARIDTLEQEQATLKVKRDQAGAKVWSTAIT